MAIAAVIISAVSAGVAADQAKKSAIAARQVAAYNAAVKRNQATAVENAAVSKRGDMRLQLARDLAEQRSISAAKGISLDSETSLSIFSDTVLMDEIAGERLAYNTQQKAKALRTGATISILNGEVTAANAINAGVNASLSSAANAANSASSIASAAA